MKIAIFGSAENSAPEIHKKARKIGEILAKKKHIIITGACSGLPYESAKSAFKKGGKVIGFSPARNKKEHVNKFKDPINFHSKLIFIPRTYEHSSNPLACYKYRNINSVLSSDKVIIIGGRYGTLNEFTIAYELGKEIGVLSKSGGIADIIKIIINNLNKKQEQKSIFRER